MRPGGSEIEQRPDARARRIWSCAARGGPASAGARWTATTCTIEYGPRIGSARSRRSTSRTLNRAHAEEKKEASASGHAGAKSGWQNSIQATGQMTHMEQWGDFALSKRATAARAPAMPGSIPEPDHPENARRGQGMGAGCLHFGRSHQAGSEERTLRRRWTRQVQPSAESQKQTSRPGRACSGAAKP